MAEACTRARRLSGEWALLGQIAASNPEILFIREWSQDGVTDIFTLGLRSTPAWESSESVRSVHEVEFRFPRFFPALPVECFIDPPAFHPNIHPVTGFVCLWKAYCETETLLDAVLRLRSVLSAHSYNASRDHVMQPEALQYYEAFNPRLSQDPLQMPDEWLYQRTFGARPVRQKRKRLQAHP